MKRIVIIIFTLGSAIAFVLFANLESLSSAILSMPASSLLVLILLLAGNELVKGARWSYLLRSSHLCIRRIDALTSYLASQAATALPGGSVLTARLAEEHGQIRIHQAFSSLVAQIVTDFFASALVAIVAILLMSQPPLQILMPVATIGIGFAAIVVFRSTRVARTLTNFLMRWRLTRRFVPEENDFWTHSALLMRRRVVINTVGFSVVSTVLSATILWIIVMSMTERGASFNEALYSHSFSLVARHVIPIPGGIGISDASLAGVLNYVGIGLARATFIALAYRTIGIIFRTFLGLLVLVARYPYLVVGALRVPAPVPAQSQTAAQEPERKLEPSSVPATRRRAVRLPRRHPRSGASEPASHEAARHTTH